MNSREVEERLKYMLKRCDAFERCKYFTEQGCCEGCYDAVQIAVAALEQTDDQEDVKRRIGRTKLVCNFEGKWGVHDDSFDIVIHCKDEEEQKKAQKVLEASQTWIPVEERVPGDDRYILLSFANFSLPAVGRYEDGTFYVGDCDEPISEYGFYVNAWMELPESYRGEVQE